jgi:hypothetical protein
MIYIAICIVTLVSLWNLAHSNNSDMFWIGSILVAGFWLLFVKDNK